MFQEYIPKNTEFRVTIIGETICATEIHSQLSERTLHYWRRYDNFEKHYTYRAVISYYS